MFYKFEQACTTTNSALSEITFADENFAYLVRKSLFIIYMKDLQTSENPRIVRNIWFD